jgi:hypothetical protein
MRRGLDVVRVTRDKGIIADHRTLAAYGAQAMPDPACEPIGVGIWANRPEMPDAATWVAELRHREWTR